MGRMTGYDFEDEYLDYELNKKHDCKPKKRPIFKTREEKLVGIITITFILLGLVLYFK